MNCLRLLRTARLGQGMRDFAIFQCIRSRHHVDGVDEKLGGDSRFFLVLAEAEQSEARNHYDGRIGIAQLGRISGRPFVVILLVVAAIFD